VPSTIAGYYWGSTPTANQPFSGTITGRNFDSGTQVFFMRSDTQQSAPDASVLIRHGDPFHVVVINPIGLARYTHLGADSPVRDLPVHSHFEVHANGATVLNSLNLNRFFRSNSQPIYVVWPNPTSYTNSLIFWASLLGMIVSPISTIVNLILLWISTHRRKAEALLMRLEVEKRRLEIEQLRLELENMRQQTTRPAALLIVPG
jgi:hypothetical protein